jgi:hypothetical protein
MLLCLHHNPCLVLTCSCYPKPSTCLTSLPHHPTLPTPQEVSLLADMRVVVARALSALDMFSDSWCCPWCCAGQHGGAPQGHHP